MFALDLFNTDHERRIAEGAVDQLEQRRIDDLAMKMDDLVARAKEPAYKKNPAALAALMKEFQKCKAERDSYYMVRNEAMGYGGLAGESQVTPTATGIRHHAKPGTYGGYEPEADPLARLDKHAVNRADKALGVKFNREKKYQGGLDVDEAGIPGNVPTEKIPGKEDLLRGKGRSYYESQKKNSEEVDEGRMGEIDAMRQDLKLMSDRQFYTAYGISKTAFQQKYRTLLKPALDEHGGGIGPRQHWQSMMPEGQPQELINRYLAIDAKTDVEAVRKAIQAISRDSTLGATSKSRLLGQIGMIIQRHRLPIGRSYYTFMQQYMEAVELDRNRVAGYPNDPATVKHRLDTAKAILGDPRSDADSRREAAAIVVKSDKPGVNETVENVRAGMARIYRRLAPKIERHRDSFLAGQLYDELENYAELHGAEGEFKRIMATARNSAHMEYDTNPGGFQNWFWFLPFEDNDVAEAISKKDLVGRLQKDLPKVTDPKNKDARPVAWTGPGKDDYGYTGYQGHGMPTDKAERARIRADKKKGMSEGTDDVKKRMSKLEALALAANRAGDDAKCKMYQQKIQSLKQKLSQSMAEGWKGELAGSTIGGIGGGIIGRELTKKEQLNEFAPILAAGARLVIAMAPKIAQVLQSTGKATAKAVAPVAKSGSEIAAKNAVPIGVGLGAYEIGSSVADIARAITAKVGTALAEKTVMELAQVAFKFAIPAGIVLAILYGGKKVIDSLFSNSNPQQGVAEGLKPGEYHIHTVYFKDGTKKRIRVTSDEFDVAGYYTKRGQAVDRVDYDFQIYSNMTEAEKEPTTRQELLNRVDKIQRMMSQERNPANLQILRKQLEMIKQRYQHLKEDNAGEAVERAILNRIMVAHTDLLMKFGPDKVMQAAEEVAYNVGDVDEIGTSDVSAYVNQVKQILGVDDSYDDADEFGMPGSEFFPDEKLDEKWSQKYKSTINCANPKGFSQKAHCAGKKK